jgi:hypothetical protein
MTRGMKHLTALNTTHAIDIPRKEENKQVKLLNLSASDL